MQNTRILLALLLISAVTLFSFYPSLRNGFTNLDDNEYITGNILIRQISWHNIRQIFTSYFVGHYQPLSVLSYMLDYSLFRLDPFGYHLGNLILHILNALLVFWFISLLTESMPVALVTALLFAIHPLRVESVAWASERKDVLYAFFFLCALISYRSYLRSRTRRIFYGGALLFFVLSLLAKSMAVTLPLTLFLVDIFTGRPRNRKMVFDKIPFLLIALIFGITAVFAVDITRGASDPGYGDLFHKIGASSFSVVFYLSKICAPAKLCCLYPDYLQREPLLYGASILAVLALSAGAYISVRYTKKIIFGLGFFLIPIIPCMQFIQPFRTATGSTVADRYVYIASIGISYIVAEGFFWLWNKQKQRNALLIALILLMAVLSVLTYRRCFVWKDSISMWSDIQKDGNDAAFMQNSRGYAYYEQGDFNKAIEAYTRALEIEPRFVEAYSNRGMAYYAQGRFDQAIVDYNQALGLSPRDAKARLNRGAVYHRLGQFDLAQADYSQSIASDPAFAAAYSNRGMTLAAQGRFDQALLDYTKALELNPTSADVYINRADIYRKTGTVEQALSDYARALELDPQNAAVYMNRGNLYFSRGDFDKALADYNSAIAINPGQADFYSNRGVLYYGIGRLDEALADYNAALVIAPANPRLYNNRALVYFDKQELDKSWVDVREAQRLGWQVHPGFLDDLRRASSGG